jgi:hypothetical protein
MSSAAMADDTNSDIPIFQKLAQGVMGKIQSMFSGKKKRKAPLQNVSNDDGVPKRAEKRARTTRSSMSAVGPSFDFGGISLHQNRYRCPPTFRVLLSVGEEVILAFKNQSRLNKFLSAKDVSADRCLSSILSTSDGDCIALVGTVVENNPIVSQPFQLLGDGIDDKELYETGGGVVLKLVGPADCQDGIRVVITHSDATLKGMDLWITRQVGDFECLKECYNGMKMRDQIKALSEHDESQREYDRLHSPWRSRARAGQS